MKLPHPDEFTLNEYVDDLLGEAECAQVKTHLATCPACRAKVTDLRRLIAQFQQVVADNLLEEAPSPAFAANVVAAIAARPVTVTPLPWPLLLAQAVAALTLLVLLRVFWVQSLPHWLLLLMPGWGEITPSALWSAWWPDLMASGGARWLALQQVIGDWFALVQRPALPELAVMIWLPVLLLSCLLWLAATRWLLLRPE